MPHPTIRDILHLSLRFKSKSLLVINLHKASWTTPNNIIAFKYSANLNLIFYRASLKISLLLPALLHAPFNFSLRPHQLHCFLKYYLHYPLYQKRLAAFRKLLTLWAVLYWAELKPCSVCYRLLGLAERMCIYLLKVLYKSIPCFWTQVNRNNTETQRTTTATLKQHF